MGKLKGAPLEFVLHTIHLSSLTSHHSSFFSLQRFKEKKHLYNVFVKKIKY